MNYVIRHVEMEGLGVPESNFLKITFDRVPIFRWILYRKIKNYNFLFNAIISIPESNFLFNAIISIPESNFLKITFDRVPIFRWVLYRKIKNYIFLSKNCSIKAISLSYILCSTSDLYSCLLACIYVINFIQICVLIFH